jgi:3-dehydrosphinganine reductase
LAQNNNVTGSIKKGQNLSYFHNKKILITGGSSGIGLAISKELKLVPCALIVVGRDLARLKDTKDQLSKDCHPNFQVITISFDISKFDEQRDQIEDLVSDIDILIHSAGLGEAATFKDTTLELMNDIMDINFWGAVKLTKLCLDSMLKRGTGHLVYISSVAGFLGLYGYSAYSSSKFALEGFAQALRNELAATNLTVSVVYPPDTDTPMLEAENKNKPRETKAISGGVLLQPDFVASKIIAGIKQKRRRIIPGFWNQINCFLIVHFPRAVFLYIDFIVRRMAVRKTS